MLNKRYSFLSKLRNYGALLPIYLVFFLSGCIGSPNTPVSTATLFSTNIFTPTVNTTPNSNTTPQQIVTDTPEPTETPAIPVSIGTPVPFPKGSLIDGHNCEYVKLIWDKADLSNGDQGYPTYVEFNSSVNNLVLSAGLNSGIIKTFSFTSGQLLESSALNKPSSSRVVGLDFFEQGSYLIASHYDRTLEKWKINEQGRIIDLDNKTVIPNFPENIESRIDIMAYANSTIFLGSDLGVLFSYNLGDFHQIEKHPCATGRDKDNLCIPDQPYSPILDLYASPDGKYLLSGGSDNQAFVWYLDHQIIKNNRAAHRIILDSPGTAVTGTYYDDNLLIGVGDSAGHISLYKILNEYSVNESDAITSASWATSIWDVSFSNNGSLIAVTSNGGDAIIYKTSVLLGEEKGDPILQKPTFSEDLFEKGTNKKTSIAFSPNDLYFAIGAPRGVSIWGRCP